MLACIHHFNCGGFFQKILQKKLGDFEILAFIIVLWEEEMAIKLI